jgi:hypothetical protein
MGAVSSLFNPTIEVIHNSAEVHEKQAFQEKVADFVRSHFYYTIPVHTRKKSHDPVGPLWIEPTNELVEQSLAGKLSPNQVCHSVI